MTTDNDVYREDRWRFLEACRVVVDAGYTPVQTKPYQRIRAWLDLQGWPPSDWEPGKPHPLVWSKESQRQYDESGGPFGG